MFRNQFFYTIKPLIPRRLQIFLRRQIAKRKREVYSHIWPIDPNSVKQPNNWPGWLEGKRFALLLCHDVETWKGRENCLKLAQIEKSLGFRSYFNFVPQRYDNSDSLQIELRQRGFGIGVHGLKHDGKLFRSQKIFKQRATKINFYLKKWNCEGFTSPSMHHQLSWLHELNISYSTSTFDTDPFEPQPDGAGTIFPHWIYSSDSPKGYLELPHTLPQDHLLYVILQENNIDVWKKKLDWIAERGGMVLLNTHPDYINFTNGELDREEYPISFYSELLEYTNEKYASRFWNALPEEVVHFWKKTYNETNSCRIKHIFTEQSIAKKQHSVSYN